jgi:dipeptidyl aminopeptidase/acylaminoacyl peptidase
LKLKKLHSSTAAQSVNLPEDARIGFVRWSPDSEKIAFTLTQPNGLELWFLDLNEGIPRRLSEPILNAAYGTPYRWRSPNCLLCKLIDRDRGNPPIPVPVPTGPIIQENLGGKSPNRTFTNLLENPHDEALFEYYITSTLVEITLEGECTPLVSPCLIDEAKASPDGQFILLSTLHRPFSYQLPASYFPKRIQVLDTQGDEIYWVADLPLADLRSTKFDVVRPGPRGVSWRSDRPATLCWVEALDAGDPSISVPVRDALYELDAPFNQPPKLLWQSEYRFRRIRWGREDVALVWERWYDTRRSRIWRIYPNAPETPPQLLVDRSFEDRYSAPGMPLTVLNCYGKSILRFTPDSNGIYLSGRGASPDGVYPFLDTLDLNTQQTQRLWQCQDPYFEFIMDVCDDEAQSLLTCRQSQTEPPNCFLRTHRDSPPVALTDYPDPIPEFAGVYKEVVQYQRSDGVQLSAKLYLPAGYEPTRDGPLPMVFWVYPEEFKDPELAGQVTMTENTFSRPHRTSVLFLLTQGYAVLSNPRLPIIGVGEAEPNDSYVEQLMAGMQAAIDYVVKRGIADPNCLGIGGHSYGAFTTVNLLAHTDWFRVGIAMSGAYNRTLTPFGFQGEQRNFWEATETYIQMSSFTHAHRINTPLLLVHGAKDSNPGTYPLQTERLYEALKGLGAVVRLVMLPLESHSYCSQEAVGHVLWEMVTWCDRYLKQNDAES